MLFSQRKGLKPIKELIQIDTVDSDLRNGLWTAVTIWRNRHQISIYQEDFAVVMRDFWLFYFKRTLDTYCDSHQVFSLVRKLFFDGEWNECYDILEFIVISSSAESEVRRDLIENCNAVLERELSAYRFVGNQITQITSQTEITSIEEALSDTERLTPVKEHLATALNYLSDRKAPNYRNSIKESISAVEALCNLITGEKDSLGEALKKLETAVPIHPALKKGFSAIYGYTSDAGGIRHALLDEPNLNFEDAKFMLVSCSGFVNYLLAKAAKAGLCLN